MSLPSSLSSISLLSAEVRMMFRPLLSEGGGLGGLGGLGDPTLGGSLVDGCPKLVKGAGDGEVGGWFREGGGGGGGGGGGVLGSGSLTS